MLSIDYLRSINFTGKAKTLAFGYILCILTSCVTQRQVEYIQDENLDIKRFAESDFLDYILKPNDELFIQISSLDEGTANVFSGAGGGTSGGTAVSSPYVASLFSYTVDKEGQILLPLIGNVKVTDKTLFEVSTMLKDSLVNILNQPIVSVKLVNRYISVLGEVRNPGHFAYSQEKLTIFDAIGLAGDITDYGNRDQVILVRNQNGENLRINLNLAESEILASDYYNLRPNDIIYVKPLRDKFWGMRQFPFAVFFSTITTALLIYSIVLDANTN